jgi:hypothetical protein
MASTPPPGSGKWQTLKDAIQAAVVSVFAGPQPGVLGQGMSPYTGTVPRSTHYDYNPWDGRLTDTSLLQARLDANAYGISFQFLEIAKKSDGTRVVFVMHNDQAVVIDDLPGLFPSDELITKLKLLCR